MQGDVQEVHEGRCKAKKEEARKAEFEDKMRRRKEGEGKKDATGDKKENKREEEGKGVVRWNRRKEIKGGRWIRGAELRMTKGTN